jgi:hypothetical protein
MSATDIAVAVIDDEVIAVPLISIPESAPEAVREGVARRNIVNTGGTCPCGARLVLPNRAERRRAARTGRVLDVRVAHEPECLAGTERLREAIGRWRA